MKTLGLICGTSWHSTIEYYRYLNSMVEERLGAHHNPNLLMYSLSVEIMPRGDWDEINHRFLEIALTLQDAGADAIILCANSTHKVCSFIAPHLDIPIIHIGDAIGLEAKRLQLSTLALIGTRYVMAENFLIDYLQEHYQLTTIVPAPDGITRLHDIVANELTKGIFTDQAREAVIADMHLLKEAGAEGIILGCTEFPILLRSSSFDLPLIDTTYLHAKRATEFILSGSESH